VSNTPDELQQLYHQANAFDERRPPDRVRHAVLAHAQMLQDAKARAPAKSLPSKPSASANSSYWKMSLVASLLLAPLIGLLLVSLNERSLPEAEKVASSTKPIVEARSGVTSGAAVVVAAAPTRATPVQTRPAVASNAVVIASAAPGGGARAKPSKGTVSGSHAQVQANQVAAETVVAMADKENVSPSIGSVGWQVDAEGALSRKTDHAAAFAPVPVAAQTTPEPAQLRAESIASVSAAQAPSPGAPSARARSVATLATSGSAKAVPGAGDRPGLADLNEMFLQAVRAGQLREMEALVARGASINARDAAGRTALILSVQLDHEPLVERLLALGANPALVDHAGLTAIQYANQIGLVPIISLLERRN
jgi:hypothetical protein